MIPQKVGQATAWFALAMISTTLFGNNYVYDSIGPVADLLQRERGFSDTQIGMLNAIYSLPNIVLVLVGGILADRFGAVRVILWTAATCFLGAAITAFAPGFLGMATGRLLFGVGAETLQIATLIPIAEYFTGKSLAFAMGLALGVGRLGSYSSDMSPTWFAASYQRGWQSPLEIATAIAAVSVIAAFGLWCISGRNRSAAPGAAPKVEKRFSFSEALRFGPAYWILVVLCVLWYGVILAFRGTFSIKYFQHVHGLDLATAGAMNSYVFLAGMFATPAMGWLSDRTGKYAAMLAAGALLLPISFAVLSLTSWNLWVATILIGISYSLVPAVLWPLCSKLVLPSRFGAALGMMCVIQNAGIAMANLGAGWLNDWASASAQNPSGYQPMMLFFGTASAIGFGFALMLWLMVGRRGQNVAAIRL